MHGVKFIFTFRSAPPGLLTIAVVNVGLDNPSDISDSDELDVSVATLLGRSI